MREEVELNSLSYYPLISKGKKNISLFILLHKETIQAAEKEGCRPTLGAGPMREFTVMCVIKG